MNIKGLTIPSLVDWDGEVVATVFLGGCNFRCNYCYNSPLVLHPEKLENLKIEHVLQDIEGFGKYITGVCITGGEPSLSKRDILLFIDNLLRIGLKIKFDTNGTNPSMIALLVDKINYIAMDIKAPLIMSKYSKIAGSEISIDELINILESIEIIKHYSKDYEFRTTVIPTLHAPKDIEQIAKYAIKGSKKYVIQNFHPFESVIDPNYASLRPFTQFELEKFAEAARPYVKEVKIRNLSQNT